MAAFDRRPSIVVALMCAGGWLTGCARAEEYALEQPINMGPYSFEVVSAEDGQWGSAPTVDIRFRIRRDDTVPFTTTFKSSFGFKMAIVDAAGNTFPVEPDPISPVYRGGRYRSDRYLARVRLSPSHEGVRDSARIGKAAADFRLLIENPAPEQDQPRRVAIPLGRGPQPVG
jgi:hypothetical protein